MIDVQPGTVPCLYEIQMDLATHEGAAGSSKYREASNTETVQKKTSLLVLD